MMLAIQVVVIVLALSVNTALSDMLGVKCDNDGDCDSTEMECIKRFDECEESACYCKPEYGGRFENDCELITGLGDYCGDHDHCGEGLRCAYTGDNAGYCECTGGWREVDGACVDERKSLGETCDPLLYECKPNMTCSQDGKCECYQGYFVDGDECRTAIWEEHCNGTRYCDWYACLEKPAFADSRWCNCDPSQPRVQFHYEGQYREECAHENATTDVDEGGACFFSYYDREKNKYCKTHLTCSMCVVGEEPHCIKPGYSGGGDGGGGNGNAVAERVHVFLVISAISAIKLL